MSVPNVMTIKSEREVRSGQMRYRWIDLIEIHHHKLFKTPSLAFYDSKTAKNLKNGHGPFIAAIAGTISILIKSLPSTAYRHTCSDNNYSLKVRDNENNKPTINTEQ